MFYVYIIHSQIADQIYTGYKSDLQKRIQDHNSGKSIHTNKFRPWKLVSYCAFDTETKARAYEKYLKTGSGIAFARRHLI
jgi:predicted GIY-YIG superfamily endonuclease